MRVMTRKRLVEFGRRFADARASLEEWHRIASNAEWNSIADLRRDFPTADGVEVASGRTATVFNIRGNRYRLITAIHYRGYRVYVMRFLTHAEYDRDTWKDIL